MSTGRWRITVVDERELVPERRPSPSRGAREIALEEPGPVALLAAVERLGVRSEGPESFTLSPSSDPIAFLLDAMTDAVCLSRGASVLYRNRAAEELDGSARALERRTIHFRRGDADYVLEIVSHRS